MNKVESLQSCHWPQLHRLMVLQDFPGVPDTYEEAVPYLEGVRSYGLFNDNWSLKAGFVFGDVTERSAYFDVVCAPKNNGRWATPKVIRRLYDIAFRQMGLLYIWCQPQNPTALKAALQAGFVYATQTDVPEPVLVLTRQTIRHRKLLTKNDNQKGD